MPDIKLFIYSSILITIGVIMSYSLSTYPTILYQYGSMHFFIREFIVGFLGILIMWGISYLNMDKSFVKLGFFTFFLLFFVLISFNFLPESWAPTIGGARRWIKNEYMPIAIAPVEFFKIGFVFFLAWSFSRKITETKKTIGAELYTLLPYTLIFLVVLFLIAYVQNDLGQTFLLAVVMLSLFVVSGGTLRAIFFGLILGVIVFIPIIALFPHRVHRLKVWWFPHQDFFLGFLPKGLADTLRLEDLPGSYQISNATNAILDGKIFGQGIGNGIVKLGFLSDVHTDMVLAGITEETGFFGLFICFFLFFVILFRIFKIANRVDSKPYCLFCIGSGLLIGVSLLVNALGITSAIPMKGIAVPFLTYGGSSLLANCILIGIILAISKNAKNLN